MFGTFHVTVHGAQHIKKGQPCEDSSISFENELCKIFVVADGHGDANCPRSKIGSEYVCSIAKEELLAFAETICNQEWTEKLLTKRYQEGIVRQLITSIVGKWYMAVNAELENNPLSQEEREACSEKYITLYDHKKRIEHIYGTTMIAGLLTEGYLLLLQQGDGRCDVFDENGDVSQPIPWDDRCILNVTTSMCDTDAAASCRYHVIDMKKNPITACLAGSDGVEDSFFSMDLLHSYHRTLLTYAAEHSIEELREHLLETLPDFSAKGSGDDTSIGGFINREAVMGFGHKFACENKIVQVESSLLHVNKRIESMESGKMEYLEKKYQKALAAAQMREEAAILQLEKARKERDEYLETYTNYKLMREELLQKIEALSKGEDIEQNEEPKQAMEEVESTELDAQPDEV